MLAQTRNSKNSVNFLSDFKFGENDELRDDPLHC